MTRASDVRLIEDPLFLACTRPALVGGAPMGAVAANIIITATVFLAAHRLGYLLIAPAIHLVSRAICRHDPNAFRVLWRWLDTRGRARNVAAWGGASATPLLVRRTFSPTELTRG